MNWLIIVHWLIIIAKAIGHAIIIIPLIVIAYFQWRDVKRRAQAAVDEKSAGGKLITQDEMNGIVVELYEALGASDDVYQKVKEAIESFKN
ncbi:MAG: hypothetical protein KKD44_26890 [Proteobacteria bacterium]|nr:hypothetical protein [Pseudomonadota bacterium]